MVATTQRPGVVENLFTKAIDHLKVSQTSVTSFLERPVSDAEGADVLALEIDSLVATVLQTAGTLVHNRVDQFRASIMVKPGDGSDPENCVVLDIGPNGHIDAHDTRHPEQSGRRPRRTAAAHLRFLTHESDTLPVEP